MTKYETYESTETRNGLVINQAIFKQSRLRIKIRIILPVAPVNSNEWITMIDSSVLSEGEPFNQDQASESQFLDFSTKAI
jgi:hypothetical protein